MLWAISLGHRSTQGGCCSPRLQPLAPAQLFLAASTVSGVSLLSSQLGWLFQWSAPALGTGPSASAGQPRLLCPCVWEGMMKADRTSARLEKRTNKVSYVLPGPKEMSFSRLQWGQWRFLGFFSNWVLQLFPSRDGFSKLHKPPVGCHSHHSGILASHPESMLTFFFFENCHVITARSRLEATPGK